MQPPDITRVFKGLQMEFEVEIVAPGPAPADPADIPCSPSMIRAVNSSICPRSLCQTCFT